MRSVLLALSLATLVEAGPLAQTRLDVGAAIERTIAPGERHDYTVEAAAGDYVRGGVDQGQLVVFVTVFNPDGSILRPVPGPPSGRRTFAFVAESPGQYRINLSVPSIENAARNGIALPNQGTYRLTLDAITTARAREAATAAMPLSSPRLEALRESVERGGNTAAFWSAVRAEGTPLVESFIADDHYQLVTLLWQHRPGDHRVGVIGSFASYEFSGREVVAETLMTRLGSTDVWYLTLRLPRAARFTYRLSPNDPGNESAIAAEVRAANLQIDPLNPRRTINRPGATKFDGASVAELPGAPVARWTTRRPEAPSGTVTPFVVPTSLSTGGRRVWVYTPPGFDPRRAHSLVVLFDGELYTSAADVPTPTILDNLINENRIEPTIGVFVSASADRATELLGDDAFAAFVGAELVPWIRQRYPVSSDPAKVVLGGMSAGGVAAAYIAFQFPDVFGKVLSQSGAFDWSREHPQYGRASDATTEPNLVARLYRDARRLPLEFYLDAGTFEVDSVGTGGFILEPTRHLRDVLLAKGYVVHYDQFVGGHDAVNASATLGDALVRLLGAPR